MEVERAQRLGYDLLKTYVRLPDLLQKRAIDGAHRIGIPTSWHGMPPAALSGTDSVEHSRSDEPARLLAEAIGHGARLQVCAIQIIAKQRMSHSRRRWALGGYQAAVAVNPSLLQDTAHGSSCSPPGSGEGARQWWWWRRAWRTRRWRQ